MYNFSSGQEHAREKNYILTTAAVFDPVARCMFIIRMRKRKKERREKEREMWKESLITGNGSKHGKKYCRLLFLIILSVN